MIISQPVSNYIPKSILTTQGDMLIQGAAAAERLAIGAADTVVTSNGAGANPSWQDPLKVLTTLGDLVKRGAAAAERLALGSAYDILRVNSGGTDFAWVKNAIIHSYQGTRNFQLRIYDIGDWDMDNNASAFQAHGVTFANIIFMYTFIRNDADTLHYPLNVRDGTDTAGHFYADATNLQYRRTAAAVFDSADYDATSYNRGWTILALLI